MKRWARWIYLVAAAAATFVAVSSITQAIGQGSWSPIVSVGWIPAVIVAAWPGAQRRCLRRGSRRTS